MSLCSKTIKSLTYDPKNKSINVYGRNKRYTDRVDKARKVRTNDDDREAFMTYRLNGLPFCLDARIAKFRGDGQEKKLARYPLRFIFYKDLFTFICQLIVLQ